MTFTEALLLEIAAVQARLDARLVVFVALVIGVSWVLRRGLLSATQFVWRLGWDRTRRLARFRSISDLTFIAVAALLVLRKLARVAPMVTWLSLALLALVVAIALPTWLGDFVAGFSLARRRRFREGDQVRVSGAVGSVRHIGMMRTAIRAGDGGTISVPNRIMLAGTLQVGREQRAAPIEIRLPSEATDSPQKRETLLRLAHANPFRRGGSRPTLTESERGWVLTVQTWSTRNVEGAQRAFERQLLGKAEEG